MTHAEVWTAFVSSVSFYDVLCLIPLYLAIRGIMGQAFRNLWLLLLAQGTIILYLFFSEHFEMNAQLISFSFLLVPISIDAYKGVVHWKSEGFFDRVDGFAHLVTATMLVYQHPYSMSDEHQWGLIAASAGVGLLLGQTARMPEPKNSNIRK